MFEKYLKKDELITNLQELIKIPSVHSESNNPSEPFGKNTIKALEYTLNLGKKLDLKPKILTAIVVILNLEKALN